MSDHGRSACGGHSSKRNNRRNALEQPAVLRHIFRYLSTKSLLACSLVNLTWSFEARSFIRDMRTCHALIPLSSEAEESIESSSDEAVRVCKTLEAFATVINTSIIPTCINALELQFSCKKELECACLKEPEDLDLFRKMLERTTIKSLVVTVGCGGRVPKCQSVELVRFILKNFYHTLENLQLDSRIIYDSHTEWRISAKLINADDIAVLPRLTTFGTNWSLSGQKDFALKLFSVAPNLKEVDIELYPEAISEGVLPDDKLSLVKRFEFCIMEDDEEYLNPIIKLAEAKPCLKILSVITPWKDADFTNDLLQKYISTLHQLINCSQSTLEYLKISLGPACSFAEIKPWWFAKLSKLTTLDISLIRDNPRDVVRVLGTLDHDENFPVLQSVTIEREYTVSKDLMLWNGDELEVDGVIPALSHASLSVSHLTLDTQLSCADVVELAKTFPKIRSLAVHDTQGNLQSYNSYEDIWAAFKDVEDLSLYVPVSHSRFNYDSVFVGISEEEISSLQYPHGKFLRSYQLVPTAPSLTCLTKLKKLRLYLDVVYTCDDAKLAPPFLSTTACCLTLERLPHTDISIMLFDDEVLQVLHHLRQFCSIEVVKKNWKYHPLLGSYAHHLRPRNCSKKFKFGVSS